MSSSNTSPESWIGKLVWVFLRDDAGLPISSKAECGVVIDTDTGHRFSSTGPVWVVQVGDNYYRGWDVDMEEVDDWDEDLEGEDCSLETTGEGSGEHDRNSLE